MVKIEEAEIYEQWCDSCHCSSDKLEGIKKIHFGKDYGSGLDVRLCKSCRKLLAKELELTDVTPDIHANHSVSGINIKSYEGAEHSGKISAVDIRV